MKLIFKVVAPLLLIVLIISYFSSKKTQEGDKPTLRVKYINQWAEFRPEGMAMLWEILNEKYNVINDQNSKNYDLIIDGPFGKEPISNKDSIKIYYTGEAFKPDIEKYDLSIGFNFIEDEKYIRVPLYYMYNFREKVNTDYKRGKCNPNKEYFACFLVSNGNEGINERNQLPFDGCAKRNRMFHLLSLYKEVKSGGKWLRNTDKPISPEETAEWLGKCKFVISYENQKFDGYITEKLFQAYFNGAMPIYYADDSVLPDINKEALIWVNDFQSEDELVNYIKKVDTDDDLYCKIWNENIISDSNRNYENIKSQLRAKLEKIFSEKLKR